MPHSLTSNADRQRTARPYDPGFPASSYARLTSCPQRAHPSFCRLGTLGTDTARRWARRYLLVPASPTHASSSNSVPIRFPSAQVPRKAPSLHPDVNGDPGSKAWDGGASAAYGTGRPNSLHTSTPVVRPLFGSHRLLLVFSSSSLCAASQGPVSTDACTDPSDPQLHRVSRGARVHTSPGDAPHLHSLAPVAVRAVASNPKVRAPAESKQNAADVSPSTPPRHPPMSVIRAAGASATRKASSRAPGQRRQTLHRRGDSWRNVERHVACGSRDGQQGALGAPAAA